MKFWLTILENDNFSGMSTTPWKVAFGSNQNGILGKKKSNFKIQRYPSIIRKKWTIAQYKKRLELLNKVLDETNNAYFKILQLKNKMYVRKFDWFLTSKKEKQE